MISWLWRASMLTVLAAIMAAACSGSGPGQAATPSTALSPTAVPTPTARPMDYRVLLPDGAPHTTANVRVGDLLGDGSIQVFVTEPLAGRVVWLRTLDDPVEITDGLTQPVRTHVADLDGDGDRDVLVADIGILQPAVEKVGRVVLMRNNGEFEFEPIVLLDNVGRVACAEAADLDGDGDLDIAVCVFGHDEGKTLWLEQTGDLEFEEHVLDARPGAIHAFPFDADGDGDLDLAVVVSQDSEEILLFRNEGQGTFNKELLFKARVKFYGMSGIELADLDQDGDIDILFTNGDTLDLDEKVAITPNNFHGLAWLENDGLGRFTEHEIARYWGAFAVQAADVDGDSDLDLVLTGMQIPEIYPNEEVQNLLWFENDGRQNFTRHTVDAVLPPLMISIQAVDIDGDGVPEILAGSHDFRGGVLGHRLVIFNIPH